MKILNKFILVDIINERSSSSGFQMTASVVANSLYQRGVIKEKSDDIDTVKKGDEIYFNKSSGHLLRLPDGTNAYVIQERDIVLVV